MAELGSSELLKKIMEQLQDSIIKKKLTDICDVSKKKKTQR
jgi:hypothetical protein